MTETLSTISFYFPTGLVAIGGFLECDRCFGRSLFLVENAIADLDENAIAIFG